MLAERIPLGQALDAADGWGGDSYVGFEREDTTCMRASFAGDEPHDRVEMYGALQDWVAQVPDTASVDLSGDRLTFETCDPGTAADIPDDTSMDAITLVALRIGMATELYKQSGKVEQSRCSADRLVHAFTVDELTADEGNDAAREKLAAIMRSCFAS